MAITQEVIVKLFKPNSITEYGTPSVAPAEDLDKALVTISPGADLREGDLLEIYADLIKTQVKVTPRPGSTIRPSDKPGYYVLAVHIRDGKSREIKIRAADILQQPLVYGLEGPDLEKFRSFEAEIEAKKCLDFRSDLASDRWKAIAGKKIKVTHVVGPLEKKVASANVPTGVIKTTYYGFQLA